jgi:uncharacterized protein
MVIPSLACQASCKYCFGPHEGAVMDERTAKQAAAFIHNIAQQTEAKKITITFHGGEPLLAPLAVWEVLLGSIEERLRGYQLQLGLQSNLWQLDDCFIELFAKHQLSIGTSLDGPEQLCDLNRGQGYFARTTAAMQRARDAGFAVSAIATMTRQTLLQATTVADYFCDQGTPMVLHGALAALDKSNSDFALSADEYAQLVIGLYPWYLENRKLIQIETLDHYLRGIVYGNPGVCTLCDCWGMFLAIAPNGDISSCQRLAGKEQFCLGNVFDSTTLEELAASPAAQRLMQRQQEVARRCAGCGFYSICKGGCYYNALTTEDGQIDPWCDAYKQIYGFVQDKVIAEMGSGENIAAVAARQPDDDGHPLLRKGAYISLSAKPHPSQIAANARRVCAIHQLGRTNDPAAAARSLFEQRICGDVRQTQGLLEQMQQGMERQHVSLNNCYVHVTFDCNLRCSHCYANGGGGAVGGDGEVSGSGSRPGEERGEMPAERFSQLIGQAKVSGFRQIVVTGGEPLVHTQRQQLLSACAELKGSADSGRGRSNLVLRTNLTGDLGQELLVALAQSFDQVVVSVDGTPQSHDARRGVGNYQNMLANLEQYVRIAADIPQAAELSLAAILSVQDIAGEPGQSVRRLGRDLGVKRLRFRPLLPIGRAAQLDEPVICEGLMQHVAPEEQLKAEFRPLTSCGIGQNVFIKPDGAAHPCYAWCGVHTYLGNVFADGLESLLGSARFQQLRDCSVDTIAQCRDCEYRYLCGGACRAWGNQDSLDLNAAPPSCAHLKQRAQRLVQAAQDFLRSA